MPIDNTKTFFHTFFFDNDTYSADKIDMQVDPFVVRFSIDNRMIEEIYDRGKRLYRILPAGKEIIK